jgi:ribokinase
MAFMGSGSPTQGQVDSSSSTWPSRRACLILSVAGFERILSDTSGSTREEVRRPNATTHIAIPRMTVGAARPAVAVVGSTMIDLVAYTKRIPGPGETLIGDRFEMGFGGKGANQAVMARLLGADVAMITCLGSDAYGDMSLRNFASFGIDTAHVHRADGSSGVAPIWVEPDGTNRIIIVPGANDALTNDQAIDAVGSLDDVSVVLGQLEIPQAVTAAGFRTAREMGAETILNPAPAAALDPELLEHTTWLMPNEIEFGLLAGRSAADDRALADFAEETGVRLLVTLGADGVALVSEDGDVTRIDATVRAAVDTTGAGDAFVGAFAFGLANGMDEMDSIRLGNSCAGESVTKIGTQTSFPDISHSARLLAEVSAAPRP